MDVDLVKQRAVFIIRCVNDPEHALEDAHIGQLLFRDAGQVEHKRRVSDAVRLHIVMHHLHSACIHLRIIDRRSLPGNVLPPEHRDLRQVLRRRLLFLICFQLFRCLHESFHLFRGQALFIRFQSVCQLLVHTGGAPFFRADDHHSSMRVVQQPGADQPLKIAGIHLFL